MAATRPIVHQKDKPSVVAQHVADTNTFPAKKPALTQSNGSVAGRISGTKVSGGGRISGGTV